MVTKNVLIRRLENYDAQLYRAIDNLNNKAYEDSLMGANAETKRDAVKEARGLLHTIFPEIFPNAFELEKGEYHGRRKSR